MTRFANFTPPTLGSELTTSEITILEGLTSLANSPVGQFVRKSGGVFVNDTPAGSSLSGTINEIAYFDSATSVASLAVATYPSLTELTYVKGVTSAIQTQMNLKAPLASPTFTGTVVLPSGQALIAPALGTPASGVMTNVTGTAAGFTAGTVTTNANLTGPVTSVGNATAIANGAIANAKLVALTASQIVITDASGVISSAAVATYPSLTELTYVKGVTSAIQTQLDLKAPLASPTFTGTVVLPNSQALVTPVLGTPTSGVMTNMTGLPPSGLTTTTAGNIIVAAVTTGIPTYVAMSGDVTIGTTGITAIGALKVTNAMIAATTIDLTAKVTGILPTANGGTGIAYFTAAGPTVARVYTFPDEAATIARTDAAQTFTGVQTFVAPILGTPTSGTLTNCTGLPIAGLVNSTSAALGLGTIELGHATDTTLSRSAAGVLAVEDVVVTTEGTTTETSSATTTVAIAGTRHTHTITALAAADAIAAPTSVITLSDRNTLVIRIKDNATARALTWNAVFRAVGVTLPTTTVVSKTMYVGCKYNVADTKWDVIAVAQEA